MNMMPVFKLLVACVLLSINNLSAQNSWLQKSSFPGLERDDAVGFTIGQKSYVGTGFMVGFQLSKDFWEYDPINDTWSQVADFAGTERQYCSAFTFNGNGYVGTGRALTGNLLNDFYEYSPITGSWTAISNFAGSPRSYADGFSLSQSGIVGGGFDALSGCLNDFWEYHPATGNWTPLAVLPGTPRKGGAGFVVNDHVFYGTGIDNNNVRLNDFWEYTPLTGIDETNNQHTFRCYPNPSSGIFFIEPDAGIINCVRVYDKSMKMVFESCENTAFQKINLINQPSGIYFCAITSGKKAWFERIMLLKK